MDAIIWVLGCIPRGIIYRSKEVVLTLYRNLVRATSRILCAVLVTTTQEGHRCHREGSAQGTRLIPGRARLSYEERLKETGLYTLERRRLRGDMMEMFKIMKGRDKINAD